MCFPDFPLDISIHASRGGSDWASQGLPVSPRKFQSTLPVGEATKGPVERFVPSCISIHASRGGSDVLTIVIAELASDFNPRFPWGKRQSAPFSGCLAIQFQSTLPVGEATQNVTLTVDDSIISIHASRGGSDAANMWNSATQWVFQSTLPVGEATD